MIRLVWGPKGSTLSPTYPRAGARATEAGSVPRCSATQSHPEHSAWLFFNKTAQEFSLYLLSWGALATKEGWKLLGEWGSPGR